MSDIFHKIDWLNIRVEKMLNDREEHIKVIASFANKLSEKNKILEQENKKLREDNIVLKDNATLFRRNSRTYELKLLACHNELQKQYEERQVFEEYADQKVRSLSADLSAERVRLNHEINAERQCLNEELNDLKVQLNQELNHEKQRFRHIIDVTVSRSMAEKRQLQNLHQIEVETLTDRLHTAQQRLQYFAEMNFHFQNHLILNLVGDAQGNIGEGAQDNINEGVQGIINEGAQDNIDEGAQDNFNGEVDAVDDDEGFFDDFEEEEEMLEVDADVIGEFEVQEVVDVQQVAGELELQQAAVAELHQAAIAELHQAAVAELYQFAGELQQAGGGLQFRQAGEEL